MKIREKLTLTYSLSTAVVLVGLGLFIYFFSQQFHEQEFYLRLEERVKITEQLYLEADRLDSALLVQIREKFTQKLDHEIEIIEKVDELNRSPSIHILPETFIRRLKKETTARFKENGRQGIGKIFRIGEQDFAIIVVAEDVFGQSKLKNLFRILLVSIFISLVAIFLIGWFSAQRAFQPVADKILQVKKISANNLHERLQVVDETDEIGQLGTTFNELLERLELAFDLQKKFISNASHEIRNPLAAILGETEVCLSKERNPETYRNSLLVIQGQAGRLNSLVNNLLHLAKTGFDPKLIKKENIKLDELIFELMEYFKFSNPESKIIFHIENEKEGPEIFEMHGNANLIKSALSNLIENGLKFSNNLPVEVVLSAQPKSIEISVKDTGIGIPENEIKNIYEPFYRAENARSFSGFGIGLPLTQRIVQIHAGQLKFKTKEGEGSTFTIQFSR